MSRNKKTQPVKSQALTGKEIAWRKKIREKMKAGLTLDQAKAVVAAQEAHDERLALEGES